MIDILHLPQRLSADMVIQIGMPVLKAMLDDIHDRDNAQRLRQLVRDNLTPREAEIIRLRYGLGGTVPLTQREVAVSFCISRSYVSERT